jgi:hypothetical protein
MTLAFEMTTLWQSSLAQQNEKELVEDMRGRLRRAFLDFRARAATLAGEIPTDLPFFTVHDVTHLDALWETASIIAGADFPLTPTEAFVLGGAFLVHDLAMSQAAYPAGLDALKNEPASKDMLVAILKQTFGRMPSKEEIENPSADVQEQLIRNLLRLNHARQAERLPTAKWQVDEKSEPYHLIEDPELRETYGLLIGRIAHSHWWSVDQLINEFAEPFGAPAGYLKDWEVDALKIAALLRVADASHLDERRSPSFLWALRKPKGVADAHWRFQNNLLQPRRDSDRLVYTAKRPFRLDEATAWWFCYDALQMVDNELRRVDALLADVGGKRPRMAARGVAKIESPDRLAQLIKTDGWFPVDTRIRVTDVASLARHIGGEQLYGRNYIIPLRELIQNASDAIRARRLVENLPNNWGDVCVRYGKDEEGDWIEVDDNGLGMSLDILKGPLLDFGASYWGSELMINELPGLLAKGFQPTGKYGIGFFSVFMWGDHVRVTTRRSSDAYQDTRVLEFGSGLSVRPILRKASEAEYRLNGGTCIRIWLNKPLVNSTGRITALLRRGLYIQTLEELCTWLCPTIDVNIYIEHERGERREIISASDWQQLTEEDLIIRLAQRDFGALGPILREMVSKIVSNLRPLRSSSGELIGRACIYYSDPLLVDSFELRRALRGVITVGGLRATQIRSYLGVLVGRPTRATRDSAIPIVEGSELARWASEQASLVKNIYKKDEHLEECAKIIRGCGGDTGHLPIAIGAKGWVSVIDILNWQKVPKQVTLISMYQWRELIQSGQAELDEFVLAVSSYGKTPDWFIRVQGEERPRLRQLAVVGPEGKPRSLSYSSLQVAVIGALAQLWSASLDDVLRVSDFTGAKYRIGKKGKRSVKLVADAIKRP